MTKELSLDAICNHRIVERIEIEGTYPNTYAVLSCNVNKDKTQVKIFEISRTSELELYNYQGIGCTNWDFSGDNIIAFNTRTGDKTYIPNNDIRLTPQEVWIAVYSALPTSCTKCNGTKKNKDISFDGLQRIKTLGGINKVRQEIIKILLTIKGSDIFDSSFGSTLSSTIGQKLTDAKIAEMVFSINSAIGYLIKIQRASEVPDNEQITGISELKLTRDTNDIRRIICKIKVILASYDEVDITTPI